MTPIQPIGVEAYLGRESRSLPTGVTQKFFASWEDGLWQLLDFWRIPSGSCVLVPEFFCKDVVDNMKAHKLTAQWYPCDRNFQTDPETFREWILQFQPKVVVILHAVGITNTLFAQKKIWLDALPKDCILIEDSVHRVIDPQGIEIFTERHVIMDSLRKVVPLPGSRMIGSAGALSSMKVPPPHQAFLYRLQLLFWWGVFQFCLFLQKSLSFSLWQRTWNHWAELSMLAGYELIGDSLPPSKGWNWAEKLASKLDIPKIEKTKEEQVHFYQKLLKILQTDSRFFFIELPPSDYGKLRGYPLGLEKLSANTVLAALRKSGLFVRFELSDSPWSEKQKVIYLPLGPHLNNQDIAWVAQKIVTVSQE